MDTTKEASRFETWAVIEIMGHRQLAGRVTEVPIAGTSMLRIDVPAVGGWPEHTKYVGGGSVYQIHPCTEEIARASAERIAQQYGYQPMPISVPQLADAAETLRRSAVAQLASGDRDDDFDVEFVDEDPFG